MDTDNESIPFDADVVAALREGYIRSARVAAAVCGSSSTGRGLAGRALGRAVRQSAMAREPGDFVRLVLHGAVMLTRSPGVRRSADDDPLHPSDDPGPAEIAFLRGIRQLQPQQLEAWVIADMEGLPLRAVATAMDCSTEAAANHLEQARHGLRSIAGVEVDGRIGLTRARYAAAMPADDGVLQQVRQTVAQHVWKRRVGRFAGLALRLAILVAIVMLAVWVVRQVEF